VAIWHKIGILLSLILIIILGLGEVIINSTINRLDYSCDTSLDCIESSSVEYVIILIINLMSLS